MIKYVVEMYGFALEVSGKNEVEITLDDEAHMKDVIAVLRQKLPELSGKVIEKEKNSLVETCAFNIDGRFYFGEENPELYDGCQIRLLTLATGG